MKFDDFKTKALALLSAFPMKASELAKATGATSAVYNWLKKLVIAGDIVKGEDGVYRLSTNEELSEAFIEERIAEVEVIEERLPQAAMTQTTLFAVQKKAVDFGTVGQSPNRTVGKHKLLNKIVGRLVGAFTRLSFLRTPFVFIDLCAGDGHPSFYSEMSSPEILTKHASTLTKMYGDGAAILVFVEKDRATFDKLQKAYPATQNTYLINGDSKSPDVVNKIHQILRERANSQSPCFIHNDPNKVTDWAITRDLLEGCPRYTTGLATMGCNASGIKRLPLSVRREWFDHVLMISDQVKSIKAHNAYLASLRNDKSQWAYLLTCPQKWQQSIESDVSKAFKDWGDGLDTAWLSEPERFDSMIRKLFLTKKEWEGNQDVA